MLNEYSILICFASYSALLFIIAYFSGKQSNNNSFFLGNRNSPWYVVAYGMIGASLSGVTFISVPGLVSQSHFSYMTIVLGYLVGYAVIAQILLPLYYRWQLTSIYTYLHKRFGAAAYTTGASFFLLSRIIGASFRMFLIIFVLQSFVFNAFGIPLWLTVIAFLSLILLYTYRAGIKTIIWTDTLQTTLMLVSVALSIYYISKGLDMSIGELWQAVQAKGWTQMIVTDIRSPRFFVKELISGAFIAIVMTGLDQDMMQKNLSCRSLKEAQKNMYWMSASLVPVNLMFLSLGAMLAYYAHSKGIVITGTSDQLFPTIALQHLGLGAGLVFIIGLIASAYSSADSALTSLTTSFCIDILHIDKKQNPQQQERSRKWVHIAMASVLGIVIILYSLINNQAIINKLFTIAGFTYGPLLGLYSFGIFTKYKVKDKWVPLIAILSPILSYFIKLYTPILFNGYQFGFELLIINGLLVFLGLLLIRIKNPPKGTFLMMR